MINKVYSYIIIISLVLCFFLSPTISLAGQANLAWDPPDISTDVTGYMIHYGTASGSYSQAIDVGNTTSYTVSNLIEGHTYYFAVTAYNAVGYESVYSNEVSIAIAPPQYLLMISNPGPGQGTVSGSGINCGDTCLAAYNAGTVVSLSAAAAPGSTFNGWSGGGCSGTGLCTVTMNANVTITANFITTPVPTTVPTTTTTSVKPTTTTTSVPTTISTTSTTSVPTTIPTTTIPPTTTTSIQPTTSPSIPTTVPPTTAKPTTSTTTVPPTSIQATTFSLTINKTGDGSGTVTSLPSLINCGLACSASVTNGTSVTLTATPEPGSIFTGWSGGDCSGTSTTCQVTMGDSKSVTATFAPICTYALAPGTSPLLGSNFSTNTVNITSSPHSCSWSAMSNVSWIMIDAGSLGTGNGKVSYSVSANPGTSIRSGTMTIAGKTFTVNQQGGKVSVKSSNAVVTDMAVTDSVTGAPYDYTPEKLVSFKATGVVATATFSITYSSLPANPVFYKVVNGKWKQIYPKTQIDGITNISLNGNTLSFTIADNSPCDGDPAVGIIYDPVVAGSEMTNTALYFPHVDTSLPWQTEIAIINTSADQGVTGTLRALSNDGQLIETKAVTLSARGRRQITVANEFSNHTNIGYIIFDTDSAAVQGYTKFYQEGTYRVAIPAVKEVNTSDIYISHIASNAQWWTGVSLVNTTSMTKELTITFNNGQSRLITLNANEHRAFTIRSMFNDQSQPDIQSAVITNASGVIGLELFGSTGGSNNLDGILLTDKTASAIYYPHVAGDGWWTGIVAYNPSESACTITVSPYSAQGDPLPPSTLSIAGKGKYIGTVVDLGLPAQTAWFRIDSTQPLGGFELFGTVDGTEVAAYAGGSVTGAKAGVFAKIEKNNGWTGIAFVNTEADAASVTLTAYNENGIAVATQVQPVGGHAKVVNLAEEIFSQDIGNATYIAYSSDRNVVGFQINATTNGMMFDGGTSVSMMLDGLPALAGPN